MADAASPDALPEISSAFAESINALAQSAFKYGPFLFSILFLLVVVGKAHKINVAYLSGTRKPWDVPSMIISMVFLVSTMSYSFYLVVYSVSWWRTQQKDVYAYIFEVDFVPSSAKIEICKSKRFFLKSGSAPNAKDYSNIQVVVLRDAEILQNEKFSIKMLLEANGVVTDTGCNMVVTYAGKSGDVFVMPSEIPAEPVALVAQK